MATNLRIISFNCQSFRSNISIVKLLLEKCDVLFLQEILLTQFTANELDQLNDNNTIACFTPATASTSPNSGRPRGGLVVFWKISDTINFFPIMFTNRVMGLKAQTLFHSFVLLNVYLCCDDTSLDSVHEFQSSLQEISYFINDEPFDGILIIGDFNADSFKGRFFNIFESQVVDHSLIFCDVIQLLASYFTYMRQNSFATTSWLDHIACSNP